MKKKSVVKNLELSYIALFTKNGLLNIPIVKNRIIEIRTKRKRREDWCLRKYSTFNETIFLSSEGKLN